MLNTSNDHFKNRLMQEQQNLMLAVGRTDHDSRSADEEAVQDTGDKASSSYTKEFMLHISNAGRKQLQLVNDALGRLRGGGFGACITCGEALNPKRLEALPWARYCIHCQEKAERELLAS